MAENKEIGPSAARKLDVDPFEFFEHGKVERIYTDACSPFYKEYSLAYDEDTFSRDKKVMNSRGLKHPEPLIEVCSVTIKPYDKNKFYKVYGEIFVSDEWGKKLIYKRGQRRFETITTPGYSLLLNGPETAVVSMAAPLVMTINLKIKVKEKVKKKGGNIWFAQGNLNLDTSTESLYHEPKSLTFEGNLGVVRVDYIVVPCGVVAIVELSITKEGGDGKAVGGDGKAVGDDARDECHEADIFGSIEACYDNSCASSVLYKKLEHECVRVSYGDSIDLSRCLVCLPTYASLSVKVNISLKECGATEQIVISGASDFKCTDSIDCNYINDGNFRVIVNMWWPSPYKFLSDQQSQSPLSSRVHRVISPSPSISATKRIDVLSVFVGNERKETFDLCGTIVVEHWDGLAYIFRRDITQRDNLPRPCKVKRLSLKGLLSYNVDQFSMHLKLNKRNKDSSHLIVDNLFVMDFYYYHRIFRSWFDRPLCSVTVESDYFVAVHFIVFKYAVKATLKISLIVKDSVVAADSFPVVHGNLVAQYGMFEYSTSYERNYQRIVLFEELEEEDGCRLTEKGEIPLCRDVVSVPKYSSLIIEVDLHASLRSTRTMYGNTEHLAGKVELQIGDFGCHKFEGQNYDLVFSSIWG